MLIKIISQIFISISFYTCIASKVIIMRQFLKIPPKIFTPYIKLRNHLLKENNGLLPYYFLSILSVVLDKKVHFLSNTAYLLNKNV